MSLRFSDLHSLQEVEDLRSNFLLEKQEIEGVSVAADVLDEGLKHKVFFIRRKIFP